MRILPTVAVHVVALAIAVAGIVQSGARAQVLVMAFLFDAAIRFAVIRAMIGGARQPAGVRKWLLERCSRRARPGEASHPVIREDTRAPVGLGGYAIVLLVLASLAFVLANVDAHHELDLSFGMFAHDLRWALALAGLYLLETLATRGIIVDPAAPEPINYGYNTRDLSTMALAVLTSGVIVMIRQMSGLGASGWVVLGPLLFFRFVDDVFSAYQAQAYESGPVIYL